MFIPKYTITEVILSRLRCISEEMANLRSVEMPDVVFAKLERDARERSSWSSTSIEGNPLPLADVKKLLKSHPQHARKSEQEVLNYNAALASIVKMNSSYEEYLDHELICSLHKQVTEGLLSEGNCGRYRSQPVFVNDPRVRQTMYWPPDVKDVHGLMDDLLAFVNKKNAAIDPLLLAAIAHRQFVLIHPFLDGNGRTARLLTTYLLARSGFPLFRIFSFEQFYNRDTDRYFQFVGARGNYYEIADSINFTAWMEYFTEGILDELLRVKKYRERFPAADTRLESHHRSILRFLQAHGSITDREYARLTQRAKATRVLDFRYLMDHGFIERRGRGKGTYYMMKESL